MGLDPLSPAAPAQVRALLVPIGQLRESRFAGFVTRLEQNNSVRLGDVSPDSRPHRTLFSPLAFPEGQIVYNLSTAIPPASHLALTPFELYRQPLLIIGILDGRQSQDEKDPDVARGGELEAAQDTKSFLRSLDDLRADFPNALLHQLLIFDHENGEVGSLEGIISIPSPEKSRTTTVKTVMCDMSSHLLGEMTIFARRLQSASNLSTPKASAGPISYEGMLSALPSRLGGSSRPPSAADRSRSFSPVGDSSKLSHRMSLPVHMPSNRSSRSVTPEGRANSPPPGTGTPPTTFDDIPETSTVVSPPRNSSHDRSRTGSQDRGSRQPEPTSLGEREKIKGKGRIGVVIGSMYLLAGRWPDAAKELVQSANIARANSDYVWQAKALDYLLVCLLMYAWAGMDFRIPDVLRPGAERPGSNTSKSSSHKTSNSLPELGPTQAGDPAARLATLQSLTDLLPDLVNNILNLYARAWTFTDDKIPPLSFSHSTIRLSKLLNAVRKERGHLNNNVLRSIVFNRPFHPQNPSPDNIKPFISASELSTLLLRAYPVQSSEESMPLSDRTNILAAIASVLSELGYYRKKAVVLKDLLSALLPALIQARKDGAAEMGVHPAASLASLNAATGNSLSEQLGSKQDDSEQSMRYFLSLICQSFGILPRDDIQDTSHVDELRPTEASAQRTATTIALAIQQASVKQIGSQDLKIEILRSCISICEALPNLAGALQYSAELLRTAGSGIAPGPESNNGSPSLPIEEQMRLANNISRTLSAAQHLGIQHPEAEYWDEFLIRGVEIVEGNSLKALIPHARSELEIAETIEAKKEKNPFIYNPFLRATASAATEPLVVANEEVVFRVTLQNLYDFDIYIERIQLEADDGLFKSHPQSIMIGPYRTQTILLSGTPQTPGTLNVCGCLVKIRGCRERSFSIFREPWELKVDVKGRNIQPHLTVNGIKQYDSADLSTQKPKPTSSSIYPQASPLLLSVINPQPTLQLAKISLPQSAIMLLEGETRTFSITLKNNSSTAAADLVLLSFNDSTASQVQLALTSKELSEVELYELELSTSRRQSFRWLREDGLEGVGGDGIKIPPRGETTLQIEVLGKPGLSYGTIQVDYGYLGIPTKDIKDQFYTRQLKIPLAVTVNAGVDLVRSDITPLPSDLGYEGQQEYVPKRDGHGQTVRPSAQAETSTIFSNLALLSSLSGPPTLLLLDFRNSWPTALTLSLTISDASITPTGLKNSITTAHPIPPGTTLRIPIPHEKFYLTPSAAHAPIPTLNPATARQFIVSNSTKKTPEVELALREAFWYREHLLECLSARWVEEGTGRSGDVELRTLKLTGRMVEGLKLADVEIRMVIHGAEHGIGSDADGRGLVKQVGRQTFRVPTGMFLLLETTLHNRCGSPIQPLLRLQPTLAGQPHNIALDLGKKLLVNGVLQRTLSVLNPGELKVIETGFCVLSAGVYEWSACVEEVRAKGRRKGVGTHGMGKGGNGRVRAKTGELDVLSAVGRRAWFGEGPCIVVAYDSDALDDSFDSADVGNELDSRGVADSE